MMTNRINSGAAIVHPDAYRDYEHVPPIITPPCQGAQCADSAYYLDWAEVFIQSAEGNPHGIIDWSDGTFQETSLSLRMQEYILLPYPGYGCDGEPRVNTGGGNTSPSGPLILTINPFNSRAEIRYYLPSASYAQLEAFNILGQRVATLVDGYTDVGEHTVVWNASDFSTGVYLLRLTSEDKSAVKRLTLLK